MVMLSRHVVRWLIQSPRFLRDVKRAATLQEEAAVRAPAAIRRGKRIDDDVQLGYWLSHAPNLSYVRLRRAVASARGGHRSQPERALLAWHKLAWETYGALSGAVDEAWRQAQTVKLRSLCVQEPPCHACPHGASQQTCLAETRLHFDDGSAPKLPACVEQPGAALCPTFRDGSDPATNAACAAVATGETTSETEFNGVDGRAG